MVWSCDISLRKNILYTIKRGIDETDGKDGYIYIYIYIYIYHLKKMHDIQEVLFVEKDKRNELSTKYKQRS